VRYANSTQAAGREAGWRILSLESCPTAIFAASNLTALSVPKAADRPDLLVPENLSLVGHDDISYASIPLIQLATAA
jgi:LacI family transcriptional regulator